MEAAGFRIITYPQKDATFSLYSIADLHWLNVGCAKDHFYRDRSLILNDDYALFFELGDYCDWITTGHPHFDPLCFPEDFNFRKLAKYAATVSKQIIDLFKPISGKCLGFGMGNHEWNYMSRRSQYEVHSDICDLLQVPDAWFGSFIDLYFVHDPRARKVRVDLSPRELPTKRAVKIKVVTFHGAGAPATAGGKINRLKALHDMTLADLVIMGHLHEALSKPFVRLTTNDDCSEIQSVETMALITGSYLRGYQSGVVSYGERRGYMPTTLGATRAKFTPDTGEITVEVRGKVGKVVNG